MRLSLVPKEREYFRLFSEMAANVEKAGELLVALMDDFSQAKSITRQILEHEHVGDKIVHDIVKRLNTTFITPLEREDIYDLASTMDEILDNIEEVADSLQLYRVTEVQRQAQEMAAVLGKATATLRKGIDELETRPKHLRDYWIEVNRLENDGDRLVRDATAQLFDDDMKCTDIIKWKDIYELLEAAIDECERVANILESIVLKNT
jgi:predicted phosphate transport protein (TIGR00153 family)